MDNNQMVDVPSNSQGSADNGAQNGVSPIPSSYGSYDTGIFDFSAILVAAYRSKNWIFGIFTGCILLGIVFSLLTTPVYQSAATIQIEQQAAKVTGTEDNDITAAVQDSDRFLQTQLDIIRSRSLAVAVAEDEGLFGNADFFESMGVGSEFEASGGLNKEEAEREAVLNILDENLGIALPVDSRIAKLSFESPDAVLSARLANSFAENYIRGNLQRKFDQSSYAREFLKEQLDVAASNLADSERESLAYARQTRIIDATNAATSEGGRAPKSLLLSTLVQLNEELALASSRRIAAQKKWETARRSSPLRMTEVLNNLAVQRLLEEKAKLEADQKQQLERRKAAFPSVRQLAARLEELDRQIDVISGNIKASLGDEYRTTLAQERELTAEIARLKSATLDEQSQSVRLGILQREVDTNRNLYDLLLTRFNELNAQAGVQANNVAIVDRAVAAADPIKPNIPLNLALSFLAGIGLSAGFVFMREQIFDTIRSPSDIVQKLDLQAIGVIPLTMNGSEVKDEVQDVKSSISEAYATLRTSLGLALSHGLPNSIMFTSTRESEGKSSCVYATALALGRANKKVLVIDLDLRRPVQHKMFNLDNEHGMSDLFSQNATIEEVIRDTEYKNVKCISSGLIPPTPVELLAAESSRQIMQTLESQFDIVLVDGTPLLGLADAVVVGSMVESCVFVVEAGRNQTASVKTAINRLRQASVGIIGVLLNKYDSKQGGYAEYSYSYEYSQKYNE